MKRPSEVALSCLISNVCLASTPWSGQSTHHQVLKQKVTTKASAWVSPPRTVGSQYMSTLEFKKKTVPILPRHSWSASANKKSPHSVLPLRGFGRWTPWHFWSFAARYGACSGRSRRGADGASQGRFFWVGSLCSMLLCLSCLSCLSTRPKLTIGSRMVWMVIIKDLIISLHCIAIV